MAIAFDNSYAGLPERFYARLAPTPVAAPRLLRVNAKLASRLGLDADWLAGPDGVAMLAGNRVPDGAAPLAMAYAGHQFGHFVPQLGDGRANLLGEIVAPDGKRFDLHLKGAGRTPFSRGGDGRAAIGPVLREYIVSEAMAGLGIPTTRVLAAVATGERVYRETALPGAILARVASSHIRVGTFEFFASRRDVEALKALADYAIKRHDPELAGARHPYRAFLDAVIARTADLIARWMAAGFIHGVMNTDNMSIAGETIDYGPCAFLDTYHPGTVFSSIDHQGRYAYANQPRIAHWNMARLAQALLPLLDADEAASVASAQEAIDAFPDAFETAHAARMGAKLGLAAARDGDGELRDALLAAMAEGKADFTLAFRRLSECAADASADAAFAALFENPAAVAEWMAQWRARLTRENAAPAEIRAAMRAVNPAYIARNHRVEAALAAAQDDGDLALFDELVGVLAKPFDDQPGRAAYAEPPQPHEIVEATFCGT